MNFHTQLNPFMCGICEQTFPREQNLKSHVRNVHSAEPKAYSCDACGKWCKQKLSVHKQRCPGKTGWECVLCKKSFARKSGLRAHMLSHSSEKPHKCSHWGDTFKRKDGLRTHMLSHSSEKPHKCNHCGATFKRKDGLQRHQRKHQDKSAFSDKDLDKKHRAQLVFLDLGCK